MAKVKRRASLTDGAKVKINFDVPALNAFIKFCRCEYTSITQINRMYKLINSLDLSTYEYTKDIYDRLQLINKLLTMAVKDNISDDDIILSKIGEEPELLRILENVSPKKNMLTQSDIDAIDGTIKGRLQALAIFKYRDDLTAMMNNIDTSDNSTSYYKMCQDIKDMAGKLMVELQDSGADNELIRSFSFSDESYPELLNKIVTKAKRPTSILQTGIRQLNAILSPGFQSGRLYLIVGGSGKFKSGTLLNITDQIRKFNPQITPYEDGRRKTILFITMENSIEETVERIYDMYSGQDDDLRDKSTDDVYNTLKEEGAFNFTANQGIDIDMRYYGNLEIDTSEIYTIVKDLRNNGKEPIAIVLDYVKRINSTHNSNGDERVRLSYVGKELKNIAESFQIPVITAMQLNREGNQIIDAALRDNKEDVARFVGTSNIGNCWDLIEDSDWVALINLERSKSLDKMLLTFKRLKIRGKKGTEADYFNHPFANNKDIRLQTDVDLDRPVSIISMSTDLESIEEKEERDERKSFRPTAKSITDKREKHISNVISSIPLHTMVS